MESTAPINQKTHYWVIARNILYVVGMLALFLFALELMVASFRNLGSSAEEMIILATSNPFTALFIGLLITAIVQSSSTTTALTVALVASGSITLENAVPIIMGANVGTTITSTIVSLSFIDKKKEFKRAVSAGTYHDFFNILTVIILFPIEYYYGILSSLSGYLVTQVFTPEGSSSPDTSTHFWPGFDPLINFLTQSISNGFILAACSFALLFSSIILFRKLISNLLFVQSPERFKRFFFQNKFKSFIWGLGLTAAIRSSTITTSLVVPIVAKKITTLRKAAPFILGANVGTTVTAFLAAIFNTNSSSGISIALTHFLFNIIGVLIFFPIAALRKIPLALANRLGELTSTHRFTIFIYLLLTFFFVPFSLIYLNQGSTEVLEATCRKTDFKNSHQVDYRIISRINSTSKTGDWLSYRLNKEAKPGENKVLLVSKRDNALFINDEMYLFNIPGTCWDDENSKGKYKSCIEEIIPEFKLSASESFDSVYVYKKIFYDSTKSPAFIRCFVKPDYPILLREELWDAGNCLMMVDEVTSLKKK